MLEIKEVGKAGNRRRGVKSQGSVGANSEDRYHNYQRTEHLSYGCRLRIGFFQPGGEEALSIKTLLQNFNT